MVLAAYVLVCVLWGVSTSMLIQYSTLKNDRLLYFTFFMVPWRLEWHDSWVVAALATNKLEKLRKATNVLATACSVLKYFQYLVIGVTDSAEARLVSALFSSSSSSFLSPALSRSLASRVAIQVLVMWHIVSLARSASGIFFCIF